jgi:hypothetical protein
VVREFEEIPQQALFPIMALGGLDDERQGLVVDVRAQQGITLDAVLLEGNLEYDRVLIPILKLVFVGSHTLPELVVLDRCPRTKPNQTRRKWAAVNCLVAILGNTAPSMSIRQRATRSPRPITSNGRGLSPKALRDVVAFSHQGSRYRTINTKHDYWSLAVDVDS